MEPLLKVIDLEKKFPIKEGLFQRTAHFVHAVNGINLEILPNETLGLVGESGSGKSTLGRLIMNLIKPNYGQILFEGLDLTQLNFNKMAQVRNNLQMIFQDPMDSLNSRFTVEQIISEPLEINKIGNKESRKLRVSELLDIVGLRKNIQDRYPHEFSGGQRQRIGIARALALSPKLIIADEPVSALDVSIQAQILNLLKDLQKEFGISFLFIAHDINVIKFISHRVAVMYLGKIVEIAPSEILAKTPKHPYTQALFHAIPFPDPSRKQDFKAIEGEIPSPVNPPSGCSFHTRCPYVTDICREKEPMHRQIGNQQNHWVACHLELETS